jgi:uncharacterized protein (TIGR00725 family)
MEQAAAGAKAVGGETIGLLPSLIHAEGNEFLDIVLPTGFGIARNVLMASACDFMLSLPGGTGTLEEMCFALDFERPVLSWGSHALAGVTLVAFPSVDKLTTELEVMINARYPEARR